MSTLRTVQKAFSSATVQAAPLRPESYRGLANDTFFFNADGRGNDYVFSYTGHSSVIDAYTKCAPLAAILNKKVQAFNNGKTFIMNVSGKGKNKEAQGATAAQVRRLLQNPNPIQSQKQFESQIYFYTSLFEFCIVLPIGRPDGFPMYEADSLWVIPPYMLDIEETEKLFFRPENQGNIVKKIVLRYRNETTTLSLDDVFIVRGTAPSFSSLVLPESRVSSHAMVINNIIGAYESRNVLINYRGALGILSAERDNMGVANIDPKAKIQLQEDFMKYGLTNRQWKFIITTAALKWQQMGIPTKDLMLFEEIDDDIQRLCDGWNFPYRLLASDKSNSLGGSDIKEFRKELYQNGIIPETDHIYEQLTNMFGLGDMNLAIIKDFSHIPAMQEDEGKKAIARKTNNEARQIEFFNNLCTLNEWRESNGDDPLEGEDGKKFYYQLVQQGWVFAKSGLTLSDLAGNSNQNSGNQNTAT